jgi:ABC-type transporter MlaC component
MRILRTLLAVFMLVAGVSTAAAAPQCDAADFVIGAGNAIDRAARARSPAAFSAAAARYTDLHAISLFALGRYRKLLPNSRQAEYMALTRKFMGRFMAEHATKFRAANLRIVDCTGTPSARTVSARLASGHRVIFKLYHTRSGYRIRDMNVESIWLAQQLRSTFTGVINRGNGNINSLLTYLQG